MDYFTFYSQHVKGLQKSGRNYLGYCPFHPDEGSKRRGFTLNPDDGMWYCFSCKKGGQHYCRLQGWASEERLFIRDGFEIRTLGDLERAIKQRAQKNLFVVIDDLQSLHSSDSGGTGDAQSRRAGRMKSLSSIHAIPVLCRVGLMKVEDEANNATQPHDFDMRETGILASCADIFFLLQPEAADQYEQSEEHIVKLRYAKNKLSDYRKVDTLKFFRQTSRIVELW